MDSYIYPVYYLSFPCAAKIARSLADSCLVEDTEFVSVFICVVF